MAQQFYTLLTNIGKTKLANASIFGKKINLTTLVVGDSNGNYYNPTEDQEKLVNEVWRGNIHLIAIDEQNSNWIKIETVIPSDVGGFTIREVGGLDDEGNLILIAKYPETYKPILNDGATKELKINTILEVSNVENVTLKIKNNIITATMEDIEKLNKKIENIKVPVTKVNDKTGDIVLKAEDISCSDGKSVESHLEDIVTKELPKKIDCNNYVANNAFAVTSGTSTAYTITLNPVPQRYEDGMQITIKPHISCGNSPTLNVNSLGALLIKDQDGENLLPEDIKVDIPIVLVRIGSSFFICNKNKTDFFGSIGNKYYNKDPWCYNASNSSVTTGYKSNFILHNNKIYHITGKMIEMFNINENKWTAVLESSRDIFNTFLYKNKIYCFGNNYGDGYGNSYTDFFIYDISTNTITSGAKMSCMYIAFNDAFKVNIINNKIYCIGISELNNYKLKLLIYDIDKNIWQESSSTLENIYAYSNILYNNKIYYIGGFDGNPFNINNTTVSNLVQIYNINTDTWSRGTNMITGRYNMNAIEYNNNIYCFSGRINNGIINKVEVYNIGTNTWSTLKNMSKIRWGMGDVLINDEIYFFGGEETAPNPINKLEVYNISSNKWFSYSNMKTARHYIKPIRYKNAIFCLSEYDNLNEIYIPKYDYERIEI